MKRTFMLSLFFIGSMMLFALGASAQVGTPQFGSWDPGAGMQYHSYLRDSASTADSQFVQYSPVVAEYYRGFSIVAKSLTAGTFRFVLASSPVTAIDSTIVTAQSIGNLQAFASQKRQKTLLTPGLIYYLEWIPTAANTPIIRIATNFLTSIQ